MLTFSRRALLANASRLGALASLGSVVRRVATGDPLHLPIGIQLYTVGEQMDADAAGTLKQIAAIGYKEVETAGFGSLKTASALRKAIDDNGLKCPSAHLSFDLHDLQKSFDEANALGAKYATASVARMMLMPPMNFTSKPSPAEMKELIAKIMAPMTSDELKRLTDAMNTAGAGAKRAGLVFAAHNHVQEFALVDGKPAMDYVMQHTDPDTVKFEFDCGWIFVAGYKPSEFIDRYPGRVKMLHIKDFLAFGKHPSLEGENAPQGTELGRGVVPNKQFLANAQGKGIEHYFVEQEPPFKGMPAMEAAKADYAYLHALA